MITDSMMNSKGLEEDTVDQELDLNSNKAELRGQKTRTYPASGWVNKSYAYLPVLESKGLL